MEVKVNTDIHSLAKLQSKQNSIIMNK